MNLAETISLPLRPHLGNSGYCSWRGHLFTAVHPQAIVPPINWARIDWAPLGDVLSAAAFPLLATFQLDVDCVSPGCDAPLQVFVDDATRGLHRLQAPGIFKCAV
ncbi:hypothetical protein B0H11DRAFT_2217043 [Mycena galericulata]|nr:hypothetical protein B0H11DRAFT_2217043 [Mycena galericulata]